MMTLHIVTGLRNQPLHLNDPVFTHQPAQNELINIIILHARGWLWQT